MESLKTQKANLLHLLMFLSCTSLLVQSLTPEGTIERTTKQQILASIPPPSQETTPISGSQLFLTSPSGKYTAFLLRHETTLGAGGFGSDFCYIQVQDSGESVWESECTPVSNVNTCTLVLSDAGFEIFDGSQSAWDTDVDDDEPLERLELMDSGDMQMRDKEGELVWKASDNPVSNQNCGSVGAPGLIPALPPFAAPIHGDKGPFGQPLNNNNQQQQQQQQPGQYFGSPVQQQPGQYLGSPVQQQVGSTLQPFSGFSQAVNGVGSTKQPLVDNTPFDSGSVREKGVMVELCIGSVAALMVYFGLFI